MFERTSYESWFFTVQISVAVNSIGKLLRTLCRVFGIVRSLLIAIVRSPPRIASDPIAVCGINRPKMIVAPTNGAVSNQIRAQTIVERAQIFFFSGHTSSVVQVVSIARVEEMAIFEIIAEHMRRATWASPSTIVFVLWSYLWECLEKGFSLKVLYLLEAGITQAV